MLLLSFNQKWLFSLKSGHFIAIVTPDAEFSMLDRLSPDEGSAAAGRLTERLAGEE